MLESEREQCAQVDPRTLPQYNPNSAGPRTVVETNCHSPALRDALEAGEPVKVQGRQLRKYLDLRRDQAFKWFEITPDDQVVPA